MPAAEPRGSAPAELFLVDGGPATVGVIASVTRPFCGDCDRVRLTADGQVRNCLFAREESDLRAAMRAGATDDELADRWVARWPPSCPATASTTRRSSSRTGRCRPSAAELAAGRGPPTLCRRLDVLDASLRNPRAPRNSESDARCSSHASQTLRRSGVCSLGLFQSSAQTAGR